MTARPEYPALVLPATVTRAPVTIWSNGVALDGDLYRPRELGERPAPGVVLTHGWGGSKSTGERYGAKLAEAGMIALCFTHAGWEGSGGSERELVDPLVWIQSYRSAVDYLEGEPGVDPGRLGAWGTSYGGGIAMYNAAHDRRIKALAVQVAMVSSFLGPGGAAHARQRAIDLARGKIGPAVAGLDPVGSLAGSLHVAHALQYDVIESLDGLAVPTLMMDAENETFFRLEDNCQRVRAILEQKNVPVSYRVIRGIDHYGIYFGGFEEGSAAALDWFRRYL
jgi:dienelactone hydrolase